MKILFTCFFLFSVQTFCQSYLNIHYTNGSDNSMLITSIQKITFNSSGDQINFYYTDASTLTENIISIQRMTFEENPVPVELLSFVATIYGSSVTLKWITLTEIDNYGFEIERTTVSSAQPWKKIGFVQGSGNSNSPKEYSFTDNPQGETKFQYRLKQIDNDGKYKYSDVISTEIGTPIQYELKQNTPNPFNPTTIISYSLPKDGLVTLNVYDIIGREVASLVNEHQKAGSYSVTFDGGDLASGVYVYRMNSGEYSATIKMLLMK